MEPVTPFDRFWSAYPRKVGKRLALQLWKRFKLNGQIEQVLAAIKVQQKNPQWRKDGGVFCPHPSTWLRQGRWEDDPTAHNGGIVPEKPRPPKPKEPTTIELARASLVKEQPRRVNEFARMSDRQIEAESIMSKIAVFESKPPTNATAAILASRERAVVNLRNRLAELEAEVTRL